ncbi:hypothetical protein K438DRAFT_1828263 [Mycena galopus ATCC 62051]|nr:hypothetical protein K438DRAFT_1828263 [Mycena galopus ATCC 62051]
MPWTPICAVFLCFTAVAAEGHATTLASGWKLGRTVGRRTTPVEEAVTVPASKVGIGFRTRPLQLLVVLGTDCVEFEGVTTTVVRRCSRRRDGTPSDSDETAVGDGDLTKETGSVWGGAAHPPRAKSG